MTSEEETIRQLAQELQMFEGTAEALQSRINMVSAALNELMASNSTLEGLEKEKDGVSLLVPIGGSTYVNAELGSVETVLVGIGAGVTVEKTLDEAKETISNRINELERTRTNLQQQLNQVVEKIREDRTKLQELTVKYQ